MQERSGRRAVPVCAASVEMLDELGDWLLRHCGSGAWRRLFLDPAYNTIRFETRAATLLAADSPFGEMSGEERDYLGQRLQGTPQPSRNVGVLLAFAQAEAALRAALALHRLAAGARVRASLVSGDCLFAHFVLEGRSWCVALGATLRRAEEALLRGAAGSILVCRASCAALGPALHAHAQDGLLATETENDEVLQASITLVPHLREDFGTGGAAH